MAPVQEANGDNIGNFFSILYTIMACCVYSMESPLQGDSVILMSTHNIQFYKIYIE